MTGTHKVIPGLTLYNSRLESMRNSDRLTLVYSEGDCLEAERVLPRLVNYGVDGRIVVLPHGVRLDEFMRNRGSEEFRAAVEKGQNVVAFKLAAVRARYDLTQALDLHKAVQECLTLTCATPSPVYREALLRSFAEGLGMNDATLRAAAVDRILHETRRHRWRDTATAPAHGIEALLSLQDHKRGQNVTTKPEGSDMGSSTAKPRVTIETFDKKRAEGLLARHAALAESKVEILQRNVRESAVSEYAKIMRAGEWRLNGDAIRIDSEGRIIDGQHRLRAIVLADVTIESVLIVGLAADVFDTIDVGRRRTAADCMTILGETNCSLLAGALAFVRDYENMLAGGMMGCNKSTAGANRAAEDVLKRHPGIRASVAFLSSNRPAPRFFYPSSLAAIHYLCSTVDKAKADMFVRGLVTGIGLHESSPVLVLRNLMVNSMSRSKAPMSRTWQAAVAIKAWNALCANRRVGVLKFADGETFPLVAGSKLG